MKNYIYQNGELIMTEDVEDGIAPPPQTSPGSGDIMAAVEKMLLSNAETLSDEQALDVAAIFPAWADLIGQEATLGQRVWYDNDLFKCVQPHTIQADWTPRTTPALWVVVSLDEWPEWSQPLGSEDAYNKGDKVSHNDKHWISDTDNNVWEPGVYGWTEQ